MRTVLSASLPDQMAAELDAFGKPPGETRAISLRRPWAFSSGRPGSERLKDAWLRRQRLQGSFPRKMCSEWFRESCVRYQRPCCCLPYRRGVLHASSEGSKGETVS